MVGQLPVCTAVVFSLSLSFVTVSHSKIRWRRGVMEVTVCRVQSQHKTWNVTANSSNSSNKLWTPAPGQPRCKSTENFFQNIISLSIVQGSPDFFFYCFACTTKVHAYTQVLYLLIQTSAMNPVNHYFWETVRPAVRALDTAGKCEGHLGTGHEGTGEEQRYSPTLSLTSTLYEVGGQHHAPVALPPGKRPSIHCIGRWVGPRTCLDRCRKSRLPQRDSIPGLSSA